MRRTILAVSSMALLVLALLAPPAAQAADATYTVVGHPLSAAPNLGQASYFCYTGAPQATPTLLERQGGTAGTSALGWQMTPAGSVVGPRAILAGDPTSLNRFEVDVLAPTGSTGWVHVYFEDDGDGTQFSQNEGWAELTVAASSAWQHLDLSTATYDWNWWVDGVQQQGPFSDTMQGFAGDSGYIANATYDVLLGCGAEQVFMDRLMIGQANNSVAYDFEAKPVPCPDGTFTPGCPTTPPPPPHQVAHLEWSTDGEEVKTGDSLTIRYGQSLWMLGHGHVHSAAGGNDYYSGGGTLTATPTKGSVETSNRAFGPDYYAAVKVSPEQTTTYRFTAEPPPGGAGAITTDPVTVYVESRVKAKVLNKRLVQGQKLAIRGAVTPGTQRVKVFVQRQRRGEWKNIAASLSGRGGKFTVRTKVRDVGTWSVRVKVGTTETNVGTVTKAAKVRVDRYVPPKPKPKQPPPPPPVATPQTVAPVVTPVAPQVSNVQPMPDRPKPTGRTTAVAGAAAAGVGAASPAGKP